MPIGYLKKPPRVEIDFDRDAYRVGDELVATVTVHANGIGQSVRRAVAELILENRYTHVRSGQVLDTKSYGNVGGMGNPMLHSPFRSSSVTEERLDRIPLCQVRMFESGRIGHRTESVQLRCQIEAPKVRRTTESRYSYVLYVHMDMPFMRDVEVQRAVPVQVI